MTVDRRDDGFDFDCPAAANARAIGFVGASGLPGGEGACDFRTTSASAESDRARLSFDVAWNGSGESTRSPLVASSGCVAICIVSMMEITMHRTSSGDSKRARPRRSGIVG